MGTTTLKVEIERRFLRQITVKMDANFYEGTFSDPKNSQRMFRDELTLYNSSFGEMD